MNELHELTEPELARFMQDVARAARAMKAAFTPAQINYGAYSDNLPHLHLHLVPQYVDGPAWRSTFSLMPEPPKLLSMPTYAEFIAALRKTLSASAALV